MTISTYRNNIARLTKQKADLDKKASDENEKVAKLVGEIARISRSISQSTSLSTIQSKQRQIETKQRTLTQHQKKAADYSKQSAQKLEELNRNLQNLERAESQQRKKEETDAKKRRQEEIRHARDLTRETERQARLHAQLGQSKYVIDLSMLPAKIKVLFLASNPQDQDALRLDEEVRDIKKKLRSSEYRDSVELISEWAVRPGDILQALNEHRPKIVHFSGHGSDSDELVLQNDAGTTKLVTKEAIVATMSTMVDEIALVFFNACFSSGQAEAVTEHVDFAIGMNEAISDEAARIFAAQFYSAIGFGRSVRQAFNQGVSALMLEGIPEEQTPQLLSREGIDPDDVVLVRPADQNADEANESE